VPVWCHEIVMLITAFWIPGTMASEQYVVTIKTSMILGL
jgi:hypothetical protein